MTDILHYLQPIDISNIKGEYTFQANQLGEIINVYSLEGSFPDLKKINIALIGVQEDRAAFNNTGCGLAPDMIRKHLYPLFQGSYPIKIADLGNIKKGFNIEDSYFALKTVIEHLIKNSILPIILGGSQDLTYANYLAYEHLEQTVNVITIDSALDLGELDGQLDSRSYLSKIILHQPNFLFNFSNIGYQTYFVDQQSLDLMAKLYFDVYRLGQVRENLEEVEPIIRNADILSFDISAIRQPDAPANSNASPNGFYGEEACQIMRYAGMSDKLSSIGLYEVNPSLDKSNQSTHLVAQMIWYFIDGYYNRKKDFPIGDKTDYLKYRVAIKNHKYEIVFYKSNKSDRWWMLVPFPSNKKIKYERHHLVPCSYSDYQTACKEEMPDRWWQTFQKLS